ncbi:hypothetical protein C4D60_Mb01t05690 [Musa balbisiana]|uniref:Uncharacterized protein n=1 Tax=Musa balbisiana TaxID=52838 RepID=A0A4S8JLF4_MUSBA|nr:hypothetical protein C4D60_Mb01t05690 [Musa balbisiana]
MHRVSAAGCHLEEEEKQVEESLAVESSPPLSTFATSDTPPTTNYRAVRSAGRPAFHPRDKLLSGSIIDLKQTTYGAGSSFRVPITDFCHLFNLNKVCGQLV